MLVFLVVGLIVGRYERKRNAERFFEMMEAGFAALRERQDSAMQLIGEKLDGQLRILILTDGKAKESIAAVEASLHRLEMMEVRVTAHDHRLAIIERSQELVLMAAREMEVKKRFPETDSAGA